MAKNLVTLNVENVDYSIRPYGTCSTSDATSAKTVNISGFTLCTGATVLIKFTTSNKANNITLNVNGTGAKPVQGINDVFYQGVYYEFLYDGANWVEIGERLNHRPPIRSSTVISRGSTTCHSPLTLAMAPHRWWLALTT